MFCIHEILAVLSDKPMGTSEVAKKLGCHNITALRKLHELHDDKKIEGRKIRPCKAGEWVWWKLPSRASPQTELTNGHPPL